MNFNQLPRLVRGGHMAVHLYQGQLSLTIQVHSQRHFFTREVYLCPDYTCYISRYYLCVCEFSFILQRHVSQVNFETLALGYSALDPQRIGVQSRAFPFDS